MTLRHTQDEVGRLRVPVPRSGSAGGPGVLPPDGPPSTRLPRVPGPRLEVRDRAPADTDRLAPAQSTSTPRVVIAHDYLTQRGGAERVVLALSDAFPDARIQTSVYWEHGTYPAFASRDVRSSFLSGIPAVRSDPRKALPVLASVWSRTVIDDADVVICSSSGWAHGVTTSAKKIVYCHNPARWLYQPDDYLKDRGLLTRKALAAARPSLQRWDRSKSASAQLYLANSSIVARRIARVYQREARVVHPPVALPPARPEPVPGLEPGFLMTVGRPRGYKNTDVVAQAVASLPGERLVVVGGLPPGHWPDRVVGLDAVSDAQLRWLYSSATAVIACAHEDFGLTPIEAYASGTPALVLRAGGYLDTTVPGLTGEYVDDLDPRSVAAGIRRLRAGTYDPSAIREHAGRFSQAAFARTMQQIVAEVDGADQCAPAGASEVTTRVPSRRAGR